jgi:hypothetical protein
MTATPVRLATVKEAMLYAKMGKTKLYAKLGAGAITAYTREGQTLVDLDSIDAMNARELVPWKAGGMSGGTRKTPNRQTLQK